MGIFGWSYPPGCDGPPEPDAACEVCGLEVSSCECPECPVCGEQGNPACYREHGLKTTVLDKILELHAEQDRYAGDRD